MFLSPCEIDGILGCVGAYFGVW